MMHRGWPGPGEWRGRILPHGGVPAGVEAASLLWRLTFPKGGLVISQAFVLSVDITSSGHTGNHLIRRAFTRSSEN